ncbi:TRAP transporter large permease [Clostridiaceae bacterium]|nr:TRAP transporter large permease [Clostridiaceae bacterium]RKI16484.1 TRAP transporter large permease [bacterium 1XD21-70]
MAFLPVLVVFILYFSGIPIAFALFAATLLYFGVLNTGSPTDLILQKFITSTQSFPMLAIPFFVMAGSIMNYAGISNKLMSFADVLTGHMKGGLAQVNVLLSMLMGGVSGSANADAAMQCKMLVPEMEKRGYSKGFSAAITAASSAVTPVIPPGINLIVYALIAGVSVGKVFMAGYVPGIFMAICLMFAVHFISKKRNYAPSREKRASGGELLHQAVDSIWALLFPFGIILGLRIGLFTPSEAGAVAVLYCTVVGAFIYKELKPEHFPKVIRETIEGTSSVMLIIVAANVFGYYMSWERIPQMLTELLLGITQNKYVMLMIINVLLLILGMFLEGGAALIILAPLLVPVVKGLGVDLVHFGLVCIVNIMIGGLTPPFGSMMFTCCSITGCELGEFVRECIPFIIALLIALMIVTYFPTLTMFVPNLLYG